MVDIKQITNEESYQRGEAIVRRINRLLRNSKSAVSAIQLSAGLAFLALFATSIGIILFYSFLPDAPPQGGYSFTLENYRSFLTNGLYRAVVWDSFVIAVSATVASLVMAYPIAYYLAFSDTAYKGLLLLLIIAPFWINLVIRTYAWRLVLGNEGIINYFLIDVISVVDEPINLLFSRGAIIVGLVHIFLPYMALPIYVSLDRIDRSHMEAAQNLGANRAQAFYEVILPQSYPGIAAGTVLSFVLGFGAFVVPLLLGGSENTMIANIISDAFLEFFDWSLGSAMAISVAAFVLLFVYLFNSVIGLGGLYGSGGEPE